MLAAGLVAVVFRRIRQPAVLGYLLAGLLIGPHILPLPLIESEASIHTLAELGVVFLLFFLGLEFNFRKLRQAGPTVLFIAPLETTLMFILGFQIGRGFGWATMDAVYLGAVLMISSTTIISKTLSDTGRSRELFASVIFAILIVEDVIAVLLVASLAAVAHSGGLDWEAITALGLRLAGFMLVLGVLGLLVVPRLLAFVARFLHEETMLVTVLGLCFGVALLAEKLGFSAGLGAFIIGAIIAESDEVRRVERLFTPLRDWFSAVFFVAIGLLINPTTIADQAGTVAVMTAAVVVGKVVACSFGSFLAGCGAATSIRVGLGLAQIGEFSFIIAALGISLGATSGPLQGVTVAVAAITSALTPYLMRLAPHVVTWHDRLAPPVLKNYQRDYTQWVRGLWEARPRSEAWALVRRVALQIGFNVALVTAFFAGAIFVHRAGWAWVARLPTWAGGSGPVLWATAMLLSLPVIVVIFLKLRALSLMLSEVTRTRAQSRTALGTVISNTLLFAGSLGLGILLLVLSSPLLPAGKIFWLLCAFVVVLGIVLRTVFVRLYSQAQVAIQETLGKAPPEAEKLMHPHLPEAAELHSLRLGPEADAVGRTLRELDLRARTGVAVVVLRRAGSPQVNPGADTCLQAEDELVLLGDLEQLERANELLRTPRRRAPR